MKETEALLRIQQIDLALMRDEQTLGNMPQTKKIQAVAAARKKVAGQISKLVGLRKDAQMDLDENERSQRRLREIAAEAQLKYTSGEAGYRELADIESQLTDLAKRIEKREFKHGELVRRVEEVANAERNARALDERLAAEGEALLEARGKLAHNIEADVQALKREREAVDAALSDDVRRRYAAASRRFGGLAVETIRGNQPSVCRVTIPASSVGDIRRGPSIGECPYCHRLLVTDGMFGTGE